MRAVNRTRDRLLGRRIRVADTFFLRLRGLLGTKDLPEDSGLWIAPCSGIHSIGMQYEFDALFLDGGGRVVGLYQYFTRCRISRVFRDARGVLELPAGTIGRTGTEVGDEIALEE